MPKWNRTGPCSFFLAQALERCHLTTYLGHSIYIMTETLSLMLIIHKKKTECQYLPPIQHPNNDDFHVGPNPQNIRTCSEPSLIVPIFHLEILAGSWHYSKSLPTRTLPISALIPSANNFDCVGKIPLIIHVLWRMIHKGADSIGQQVSICLVIKNSRPSNGAEMQIQCPVGATRMSWKEFTCTYTPNVQGFDGSFPLLLGEQQAYCLKLKRYTLKGLLSRRFQLFKTHPF